MSGVRVTHAVAAENEAWNRARERRADAEYALEQFEESRSLAAIDYSDEEFEERRESMREAIREAKRPRRTWHRAERAEREIPR